MVALLVFGPRRLPEIARAAGRGLRELTDSHGLDGYHEARGAPRSAGRARGSEDFEPGDSDSHAHVQAGPYGPPLRGDTDHGCESRAKC